MRTALTTAAMTNRKVWHRAGTSGGVAYHWCVGCRSGQVCEPIFGTSKASWRSRHVGGTRDNRRYAWKA